MESNFNFLKNEWPALAERTQKAEQFVVTDPRTSLTYARMALELAVNWMYKNDPEFELPYDTSLNSLMKTLEFKEQFSHKLYREIELIRKTGNLAIHNKPVKSSDARVNVTNLYYFLKWFAKSYTQEDIDVPGVFNNELIPKAGAAELGKLEREKLQQKLKEEITTYQTELKEALKRNEELIKENELYKKRFVEQKEAYSKSKQKASQEDESKHPRNEYETRKYLIDVMLREAGWDLQGANDKEYKITNMPLADNKSGTGYVDYVLWGDDGKPLALVEAKRTLENANKGENQAQLYADSLEKMHGQRPVMFYSNGFETFIWDDCFYKSSRRIHGFYSKQELETIIYRRAHREDPRHLEVDLNITNRTYQVRAIRSVAEHFAGNDKSNDQLIGTHRGSLLVMATGTGKTRTSIALSKLLMQANWVKRVLFLADRKTLVSQAKKDFVKYLPNYSTVNLLEEKQEKETRIVFSTYQTMMGSIDGVRDGNERFYGVGHFDLIIIDEAHRSIYKKYQAIFEYFDSLLLGLTATPKHTIDKNTYAVFGLPDKNPTDAYPFDEAVENKHLVPYRSVEVPTKFHAHGIKYKDLSNEEKEEFEKEILDGESATGNEVVSSEALNKWLFNKDTAIKLLNFVLERGIKKRGGDELGKTIIFARSQKHAHFLKDVMMEMDKEQFGNDYVKVITHSEPKAQTFIDRFKDEEKVRLPQIAISVDMLDTGVDAPSVVNLVFYKPVKSYTKFWQMIGRGSRLRPNLFGPGKDKECFYIFDFLGNFEFFEENENGIEPGVQKSLTEEVFTIKLTIAQYLKSEQFQKNEELQKYRTQLLDELFDDINSLDPTRFDVRMKMKHVIDYGYGNRQVWNHLEDKDIHTIENELASLVKPAKGDIDLARSYDKLLYKLIQKRLETPDNAKFKQQFTVPINKVAHLSKKLLKKSSIPDVQSNLKLIEEPLSKEYWLQDGVNHLEKTRANLRNLMKYIDPEDQIYVTTNFTDKILIEDVKESEFTGPEAEHAAESPFEDHLQRLEKIVRENKSNVTISRIRRGVKITHEEIKELEEMMLKHGINSSELKKALGEKMDLVQFILSLTGLDRQAVEARFAAFVNEYKLDATQIKFIETIKAFLTENGKLNPEKLYESPFIKFHNMGIEGIFNEEQSGRLINIITDLNQAMEG